MSIIKMDYFTVKCDNCGKYFSDEYSGFSAWNDISGAMEYASEADWIKEDNDIHYCPDCYSHDDDDKLILKPIQK